LADGCSPLYNPNLAEAELQAILTRAQAGLANRGPNDARYDQNMPTPHNHPGA
jgi:hypothetical protein